MLEKRLEWRSLPAVVSNVWQTTTVMQMYQAERGFVNPPWRQALSYLVRRSRSDIA